MPSFGGIFALSGLILSQHVLAHSWIEQMQVISSNGSYTGDYGYPRGYMARTDPGYDGMSDMYLVPALDTGRTRINDSDYLCHPSQRTSNYTSKYPQLSVSRGSWIAMKYLENGHVTQPWVQAGKPSAGGTVFVYGTTNPDPEAKMVDVLKWSRDGTGGNGKGWLMTAQNFDDGRCHQISASAISLFRQQASGDHVQGQPTSRIEQWCETDLRIPQNITGSTLTAYWVWQWPTAIGTIGAASGKDEYYTTCMDFDIGTQSVGMNGESEKPGVGSSQSPSFGLLQQDPQTVAVNGFSTRTALTPSPPIITAGQTLGLANEKPAASPTLSMLYSLAGSTFAASGTTYALEPQGTALLIDGQLAAYVDCNNAVATGSIAPSCPGVTTPVAPATTALQLASSSNGDSPARIPTAVTVTTTQHDMTTVFVTVTASAPSVVVEVDPEVTTKGDKAKTVRGRYFRLAYDI